MPKDKLLQDKDKRYIRIRTNTKKRKNQEKRMKERD
tara:strand:+ start:92 stop:199 length:108 start_codon:yes stop_codon:yes gene_type:complete